MPNWQVSATDILKTISSNPVRPYSTFDFGREKDANNLSVILPLPEGMITEVVFDALKQARDVLPPNLVIFAGTTRWLGEEDYDSVEIVIGQGTSQFDIIRLARTDAINFDILTDDIIKKLQSYDDAYGIEILHAESDTVQLELKSLPEDLHTFSKDLYDFCPGIVDQGIGNLKDMEDMLAVTSLVYLWWD